MNNNIFKEINEKADIVNVAQAYGEKIDRQFRCNCFLHNDKDPSLQLHRETNTWWCYVCGEGYTPIDFVMKKLGLSVFDAAKDINKTLNLGVNVEGFNAENEKLTKVAEYFYRRADNSITMKVEKWVKPSTGKKEFYPYALINGKYVKGYATKLEPEDCVLYNLPEVLNSDIVFFTEGEKDADTLKELGLAGTTTPGGGRGLKSYYKKNEKLFEPIRGKKVRIVSDNDEVGGEYSQQILEAIKDVVSEIKIFNLCKIMPNLKKKGDITDVAMAVGKEKAIEYLRTLERETEPWKEEIVEVVEEEELILETREDIFNVNVFKKLYGYEIEKDIDSFLCLHNKIMEACQKKKLTGFKSAYKQYKDAQNNQFICDSNFITFEGLNQNVYNTNKYEMSPDGIIYEVIPQVGRVLVCYHPIVPIEKYRNIEDGTEKIKLAYYTNYNWNYIVVDKSVISSSQSIIKLADLGIAVTSENAKFLIKYLCEIENLNRDKIATNCSVSRLGWFNDRLVPYDKSYQIDNEKDIPNLQDKFGTCGSLEEWADFFRERRKHNNISRIVMASAVASILLKDIKQNGFTLHVWGESEYGKAQPLNTKIITPHGYKLMGDLKIGDKVIGGDGKPHKVIGIFPQGKKETYEITFADGRKTRCCKEHLWNVSTITRRNHKRGYTVMSLEDMLKKPIKTENGGFQYRIPLTKAVNFQTKEKLPINPYLLGALIGDGCLTLTKKENGSTEIYFNNSEEDVIKKVENYLNEEGAYLWSNKYTTNQIVLRNCKNIKENIKKLKLNCKSNKRFIPNIYKTASVEDRQMLLQGLFDTDGTVSKNGELKYCTKSKMLAYDVLELCHSLGYRASISNCENRPDEYYLCISANEDVFSSEKHKTRMERANSKIKRKEDTKSLAIVSIEKCGEEECQCIMVDSKEHTYLCDDYIVTHNTVACMAAQSIFGNPAQTNGKGIGINFNLTNAGLEYSLNTYNNIPLFINEMQHQKDAVDYDKLLFLISEGKGRTRATKSGGLAKENSWNNVVITNGEKNIIKDNSNAGAYNRCISCEITEYSYENLSEVADFSKENYGTVIREILKNLKNYDIKKIYNEKLALTESQTITNKQKILEALILTGDKILTDIIFKDELYLTIDDFDNKTIKKSDVVVEERAYDVVREWYISQKRHFVTDGNQKEDDMKTEIFGRTMERGFVAIIPGVLKKVLEDNGYDKNEVLNAWKRKGYVNNTKGKNTKPVRINGNLLRCVVLDMEKGIDYVEDEEIQQLLLEDMPF